MQRIRGAVQHYEWGDPNFIPNLLGVDVDGRPWAELWLGTHPNGPAHLDDGRDLASVTGPLNYLLKVLAASEPLSLQTHPNESQAVDGFRRGVYADDQPKPELLYALTDFEALCGIRPTDATHALLSRIGRDHGGVSELDSIVTAHGPGVALERLYRGTIPIDPIISACRTSTEPEAVWVSRLHERYPHDPSTAATLLLNLLVLHPGEAIYLDAGNLHAYLSGAGIELMRASDNVVRGGLTVKPVDVEELLRVLDPAPLDDPVIHETDGRFHLPGADVALARIDPGQSHVSSGNQLAVDLAGGTWWLQPGDELHADVTTFVVTGAATVPDASTGPDAPPSTGPELRGG